MDDKKLRRVSITTNGLLFSEDDFTTNQTIHNMLSLMKHKYRVFLITQVSKDGADDHLRAKAELEKLIASGAVREHRMMYCTSLEGKKSIVR